MANGEKKPKSGIIGILTGVGALITALAAMMSAMQGNADNELDDQKRL